jgi:hypothetical protein
MSGDAMPATDLAVDQEMTIGERLRSTMAAEYAVPFIAELNRMQALVDEAIALRDASRRMAERLAREIAAEYRRRLEAEAQVEDEREKVRRTIAVFSVPPRPAPRRGDRLRNAWAALRHSY